MLPAFFSLLSDKKASIIKKHENDGLYLFLWPSFHNFAIHESFVMTFYDNQLCEP